MSIGNEERTTSLFRIYSIGVAAENLKRGSEYLEVSPLEQMNMLDGEVTQMVNNYEARSSDASGVAYEEVSNVTSSIKAKWRGIGQSNRMTPPNVRRGEEVIIYQFADSDEYFWDTLNNKVGLRKLETVVFAFSGTQDEADTEPNPNNCYVLEISTHDGKVSLNTSKKNGEVSRYDIELDTKNGTFTLNDELGNKFSLDSRAKHWRMENGGGSFIEIKDKVGTWSTPEEINILTKNLNINAQQNIKTKTTTNTFQSTTNSMTTQTTHTGNMGIIGGLSGSAGGGNDGSATFTGGIRCDKDVVASGISLVKHRHHNSGGSGDGGSAF